MLEAGWAQAWNVPKKWRFLSKRQMTEAEKVQAWIVPRKWLFLSIACMCASSRIGTSLDSSKNWRFLSIACMAEARQRDKPGMFQKYGDVCHRACVLVAR